MEKENNELKKKLEKKENEIKLLNSNENKYNEKIKIYENEILLLKKENKDLINKIKFLENNQSGNVSNNDNNKVLSSLTD